MALRDQVSVPPEFEGTSARLVDVQFDLNGDRLHGTLVKLSQVISRNAKFTNTVHEEVQSLRTYVDMQLNKVNRSIGILDESTRSLKEQQFRIHDEVRAVAGVTVKKEDYEKDQRKTRGQINEMSEWITQVKKAMENTKQEITTVLDDYLPKWYKTVADDWAASVEGQISTMRQQLEQNIRSDTRVLQDTLIDRMEQVETKTQGDLAQYSAQMAARAEHDEKFDARAAEVDRSLSAISAANDHLTVMVGDFSSRTLPRLAEIEASYEDLLTLFGLEIPDIKKAVADQRFLSREVASSIDDQEEHSIMGTPDHNAPSTSLAPPSTNDTASAIVSTITVDGLTTPEAAPPGSTTTGSRPPRAARPKKPATSSVKRSQSSPPHTSITRSSPTQSQGQLLSSIRSMNDSVTSNPAATTTPTHSSSTVDRRTELLLSLPWTRQLFGDLLAQIQARSQETGADLSNQVDQQFGTIRAELNDKVGISKLQQLLVQNRDDKLYSTLDTCKKEIESLKQTKVDQKMFDGALSTKVDVSQLKAKADTEMVQTVASHTNEQVAEMRLVTDRLDKQLRELTGAGGGGSSTGGGGSQFHSLHGASGGSHGHQQHGGGGHHNTAAHTATGGGQRRSLSKPGSSGTTPQGHNLPPVSHASASGTQHHQQQQQPHHQQQQRTPQSTRLTPQQAGFVPPTSATSSSSRGAMEDSIHNQPSSPHNHRHDDAAEHQQQQQHQHRRGSTTPRNSSNSKRSPRGGGTGGAETATGRPSTQQQQHTRSPGRGDDIHHHHPQTDRPRTQGGDATSSRGRPKPDLSDMLFRMTESEFQNETKNIPASPPGSSHAQSWPTTSGKGEL